VTMDFVNVSLVVGVAVRMVRSGLCPLVVARFSAGRPHGEGAGEPMAAPTRTS
jgi:hypothetical protein